MKTHRVVSRLSLALLLVLAASVAVAQTPAAGQAVGTLTAKGKTFKLAYAAVFVDDKEKRTMLLLTEQAVPATNWKSGTDIMRYRMDKNPLTGVVFRMDDKREVVGADYYAGGDFPTSTSGIFDLKLDPAAGKTFSGSAKATASAAKMSEPIGLDVRFNATLK